MKEAILSKETFEGYQGVNFIALAQDTTSSAMGVQSILSPPPKKTISSSDTIRSICCDFYYTPTAIKITTLEKIILFKDYKNSNDGSIIIFIPILLSNDTYRALIIMPALGEQKTQAYYYNPINNVMCEDAISTWVKKQYRQAVEITNYTTEQIIEEGSDGKSEIIAFAKHIAKLAKKKNLSEKDITNFTTSSITHADIASLPKVQSPLSTEACETLYLLAFIAISIALLCLLNKVGKSNRLMTSSYMYTNRFNILIEDFRLNKFLRYWEDLGREKSPLL
jgi:hypothetical protein